MPGANLVRKMLAWLSQLALWGSLGVRTVEELEAAARAGRVQTTIGFGAAKEKNIIEAIERGRRLSERRTG